MTTEIKMPALTPTMEEGLLARWLVAPGATVKPGEVIAEIETEKATMEFEAAEAGVVDQILVPEGRGVAVGTVIATLRSADQPASVSAPAAPLPATPVPEPAVTPIAPAAVTVQTDVMISDRAGLKPALAGDANVNATPLARRLAQARGIDLPGILGSGARGKIIKNDVIPRAVERQIALAATPKMASPTIPHEMIKLTSMRRTIARRLAESKSTVPHFYIACDMRLDALLALRADINIGAKDDMKISVNDLLLKALATALTLVPDANVQFADDVLYKFNRVDIAMAVAIEGGLVTPVIADAGTKSLSRISQEAKALARRAREGRLKPEEYHGGTASLSNLGMFGVSEIVPVLNPPQALIIGVGAGERKPIVVGDSIVAGTVLRATGSFDHRAIDGALAAQLMQALRSLIEAPLKIVV